MYSSSSRRSSSSSSSSSSSKVLRTRQFFTLLNSKRASRHNGVHFFDMLTSKSGPTLVCFVDCDFEMCFTPQRRALFRQLNFQKWSEHDVLCTFWLGNVLRATTACNLSSLICAGGSARAALASLLFDPSVSPLFYLFARLHLLSSECLSSLIFFFSDLLWSSFVFSDLLFSSLPFTSLPCSSLVLSSLTLPTSAFHLSTLSEVWLLNFSQ